MGKFQWSPPREFKGASVFPRASFEDLKQYWGIPPEDTSHDGAIRQFREKYRLVLEQKLGQAHFSRDRIVFRTDPDQVGSLPTVVDLIQEGLEYLLQYRYSLDDLAVQAEEEQRLIELKNKAAHIWKEHPGRRVIWTRILALLEADGLLCGPSINWTLTCGEPQIVGVRGKAPVITVPEDVCCTVELTLSFLRRDRPNQRLDILVDWGGIQHRIPIRWKRLAKFPTATNELEARRKYFSALAQKRIYLPDQIKTDRALNIARNDACALACLYLLQGGFVSLDSDEIVRTFLLQFLRGFKKPRELSQIDILWSLIRHYQVPEHYKSFRKYIAQTIKGLAVDGHQRDELSISSNLNEAEEYPGYTAEDPPSHPRIQKHKRHQQRRKDTESIKEAAKRTGLSVRTLYDHAKKGKLPVGSDRGQMFLLPEGQEALRQWQANRQRIETDREWARLLVKRTRIAFDSAMKRIRRLQARGLKEDEVAREIARACGLPLRKKATR